MTYSERSAGDYYPETVLEGTYQTFAGRVGITNEKQNQNHSDKRNEAGNNDDGVEGVTSHGIAGVGKVADKFERDDRANACCGSTHSAHGCDGFTALKVGGQDIGDSRKGCIGKSSKGKQQCNQVEICCEYRGNEYRHTDASENDDRLTGFAERPSALDQIAGDSAAEEISKVGGEEWNPDRNQAAS